MNKVNFRELAKEIKNNTLVLPDFQRKYVWDENQKYFLSSIIAKIPIGNLIIFKDKVNSYACKEIGTKCRLDTSSFDQNTEINYLLDGQQRLTTLLLIFSDRLYFDNHGEYRNVNHLSDQVTLRRRFFLKLPYPFTNGIENADGIDIFGFLNFNFPLEDESSVPDFCSRDIPVDKIFVSRQFNSNNSDSYFYPAKSSKYIEEQMEYVERAANDEDPTDKGFLVPLFWLLDNPDLVRDTLDVLSEKRKRQLLQLYNPDAPHTLETKELYDSWGIDELDNSKFINFLENKRKKWVNKMFGYLSSCLKEMRVNKIEIENEKKERAIDIYEALNINGIPLGTYDLIIAKAAKIPSAEGLNEMLIDLIKNYKNEKFINLLELNVDWNAKDFLEALPKGNIEKSTIITQFLNLLCIVSNFNDSNIDNLSPAYCKEKEILKLSPSNIVENSKDAMKAVLDALCYLQLRQGIHKLSAIKYKLSILPIAYAFYLVNKEPDKINTYFRNVLDVWYLSTIFCDGYQYNQSTNVIKHIQEMHSFFNYKIPKRYNTSNVTALVYNKLLNVEGYNDEETLLRNNELKQPTSAVCEYIYAYYLSKSNYDILEENNNPVTSYSRLKFEAHHFIPLYEKKTINDSTSEIRTKNIPINSPMNIVLITSTSNSKIKSLSPERYEQEISTAFVTQNNLPNYTNIRNNTSHYVNGIITDSIICDICRNRYHLTKNSIKTDIQSKLSYIKNYAEE